MTRLAAQLPASRLSDILKSGGLEKLPDAELHERFARYGEHPAFDVLLRRHGPMVLGVCRRVLGHFADAEDAFQAAFLVFVRKARTLRNGERLGPWLYGVAVRVALKARARRARLGERLEGSTDMIPDPTSPNETPDWLPVLDLELQALPAKYREPIILCELRGATRAEAARSLRIPEGTLSSRLARGRALLRRRLLKHGTLLPAGGLTALLGSNSATRAAVPSALFDRTSKLAAFTTAGPAPAGTVPAGAAQLRDEVLRGMMLSKLRLVCAAVLVIGLLAVGALAARPGPAPGEPEKPKASPRASGKPVADGPSHTAGFVDKRTEIPDRDALQGLWVVQKIDVFKHAPPEQSQVEKQMVGKMQFLVVGDVWWSMVAGTGEGAAPLLAKIDAAKNPKWLDLIDFTRSGDPNRSIYELSGDKLRMCMTGGTRDPRPAEFGSDDDARYLVFEFHRQKLPPAAGDKLLVGSWENPIEPFGAKKGTTSRNPIQRVEVLDGYLFVSVATRKGSEWIGGRYTVDTTKNPKWIDVDLGGPYRGDSKTTKLYGSYEVIDGRLKLALGTTGKRLMRPLELKSEGEVLFYDVKTTKESLSTLTVRPTAMDAAVPLPLLDPAPHSNTPGAPAVKDAVKPQKSLPTPLPGTTNKQIVPYALPPTGASDDYPQALPAATRPAGKPGPAPSPRGR